MRCGVGGPLGWGGGSAGGGAAVSWDEQSWGGKALKLPLLPHRSGCGDPEELFCFFLPLLLILGSTERRSFQSSPPAVCLCAPNPGLRGTP